MKRVNFVNLLLLLVISGSLPWVFQSADSVHAAALTETTSAAGMTDNKIRQGFAEAQQLLRLGKYPETRQLLVNKPGQSHVLLSKDVKDLARQAAQFVEEAHRLDIDGQYEKALEAAQKACELARKSNSVDIEGRSLFVLGQVYYYHLKNYQKSLEYQQKALEIFKKTRDDFYQVYALVGVGNSLAAVGKTADAMETFQAALRECSTTRASSGRICLFESYALYGISQVQVKDQQLDKAITTLYAAISSSRKYNNSWVEREVLSALGDVLKQQRKIDLAIGFYKESLRLSENRRKNLKDKSEEGQRAYLKTVESTYRALADLLLAQGRTLEAEKVLEILK